MKTLTSLLVACFYLINSCVAQQTPLFSMYRDQRGILNPAAYSNNYVLNNRTMNLSGAWHVQWWNLPESPRTQSLAWEMVSDAKNSVFGAHILNDQTGKIAQTGVYGRYAYRIKMGRRVTKTLLIGLNIGAVQYRAKLNEIEFPDPNSAPMEAPNLIKPDLGVGVFYHHSDRYYAGVSIPQTFGLSTDFQSGDEVFSIKRIPHVFAVVGGYWSTPWLGNETSFVEPSIWVKYAANAPLNVDLNLRAQVSELIWAGVGVNSGFGLQPSATLRFEAGLFLGEQVQLVKSQIKTGFAFDLPITQSVGKNFGSSAEIGVVYTWR